MYILYNYYYNKTIVDYCNSVVADISCSSYSSSYKTVDYALHSTKRQLRAKVKMRRFFYGAYICKILMIII